MGKNDEDILELLDNSDYPYERILCLATHEGWLYFRAPQKPTARLRLEDKRGKWQKLVSKLKGES